jgi:hypothetical protein
MKKTEYDGLLKSVRQGGAILRGEVEPSRMISYPTSRRNAKVVTRLAICVKTDDSELLIVNKIYPVTPLDGDLIRVIDEAGEAAVYSTDHFLYVSFPTKVEQVLSRLAKL